MWVLECVCLFHVMYIGRRGVVDLGICVVCDVMSMT